MIFGWCNFRLPMNFLPCARSWLAQLLRNLMEIEFAVFLEAKYGTCFALGKTEIIFVKMARGSMRSLKFLWIMKLGFVLYFNLVRYFCLYLNCLYLLNLLNNWTRSHFGSSLGLISEFALPPSPVCLLCSVLSTGTFAVVIACTLPSGLLGFLALWDGRKAGRTASMYMDASEPPNPLWAF